ncbi:MAG: hypothetical protein WC091_03010 [Sulfuricellaceae bacterium]
MNQQIERIGHSNPKILLFHPEGESYLKKLVLSGIDYAVFNPLTDVEYKWIDVIRSVYQGIRLYRGRILRIFLSVNAARSFIRKCRGILIARQIKDMNPKAVITFVDNSGLFHVVCEHCKGISFLAIQNGGRYVWCARDSRPSPESIYHIDEYYCFGPQVKRLFERYGHDIRRYIACGSLVGGYFFSAHPESQVREAAIYDICLVSQWCSHLSDIHAVPKGFERLNEAISLVTEFVARFAHEQSVNVCVALRQNDPAERDFYNSHFQGMCVFQESDRLSFSSYRAVDASNLSIGLNSTLLSEAFGAGRKVLFVNPFNEEYWIPTEQDGYWRLSEPSYEAFRDRVADLLHTDIGTYQAVASAAMMDAMSYDFDHPAHSVIRQRLLELVGQDS